MSLELVVDQTNLKDKEDLKPELHIFSFGNNSLTAKIVEKTTQRGIFKLKYAMRELGLDESKVLAVYGPAMAITNTPREREAGFEDGIKLFIGDCLWPYLGPVCSYGMFYIGSEINFSQLKKKYKNLEKEGIKRIMQNPKCEVLITFMYEEINRFVSDKRIWDSVEKTFGTDKWKEVIDEKDSRIRSVLLHRIYENQLEREAGIKFIRSFKMMNKTNKTDYFLFFGTNKIIGLKKMKEAMWKTDESGLFQFSDATYDPDQPMLFEMKPDYSRLKRILLQNFKGKSVSITELEKFILAKTPFRETHYKRQILAPMETKQPPEIEVKCQEPRRRVGTFSSRCTVRFL